MRNVLKNLAGMGLLAATVAAQAAAPTFDLVGASGVEYTGSAPMTQSTDQAVYWLLEQQGATYSTFRGDVLVDSWLVFYNPTEGRQVFGGTITFDQPIVDIFLRQNELESSASFGKPSTTYDYSLKYIGLEQGDRDGTSVSGDTITIAKWASGEPGDYIRVLTVSVVPEPASYGLMLAGLALVGCAARRRARARD
jgi:hypothetical protein